MNANEIARRIPLRLPDDFKKYRIRNDRLSPLILITELGSEYASAAGDKDDLVSRYNPSAGDLLLWAWVGKNRTDVFVLQKDDLDRYYP